MNIGRFIAALIFSLALSAQNATTQKTGEDLYTALKHVVDDVDGVQRRSTHLDDMDETWALGYILGVRDGAAFGLASTGANTACFSDKMSAQALARIAIRVIDDEPQLRGKPAFLAVAATLLKAYPCLKRQN